MNPVRRLHFGCGRITPEGWLNADIRPGERVDLCCDVLAGIPLDDDSIDYISSQHALQEIKVLDQIRAFRELRRVLKPGGVLRVVLPDLDRAIDAYQSGRDAYFRPRDWESIDGNFITHIVWYSNTRTLFTCAFALELLRKAGFADVRRVAYRITASPHPEIVELDSREPESFYVEAVK
jgi:SAM-dependent methyltransferase